MNKDEIRQRLLKVFVPELREYVQALTDGLLAFESGKGEEDATVEQLMRVAHSCKGAARSIDLPPIETACHRLEDALLRLKASTGEVRRAMIDVLLRAVDGLADAGDRLDRGQSLDGSLVAEAAVELDLLVKSVDVGTASQKTSSSPSGPGQAAGRATVRVPMEKLDSLQSQWGDLLLVLRRVEDWRGDAGGLQELVRGWRNELKGLVRRGAPPAEHVAWGDELLRRLDRELERIDRASGASLRAVRLGTERVDEHVHRVRMFPFAEACAGLDRAVRDVAAPANKRVELEVQGRDVELDRSVVERLKAPLLHVVRNAVDHGVEAPAQRLKTDKSEVAKVTVSAVLRTAEVEVVVTDDGRGLDVAAIRARAKERGLPEPRDDREAVQLIFQAGFSTAAAVSTVSGRGVGLDVVRTEVEALHGRIEVDSTPGKGTRFSLVLPLTFTNIRAVLVVAADHVYALAHTNVQRLLEVEPSRIRELEGRPMLIDRDTPLVVAHLSSLLGLGQGAPSSKKLQVVVVVAGVQQMALVVDELLSTQEVVVKGLGPRLPRVQHFAGGTVLPTGRVAMILNAAELIRSAADRAQGAALTDRPQAPAPTRRRILVSDDSVTVRTSLKLLLEPAGYDVVLAVDGQEAWQLLEERGADLVISDVEMPRMDGFALTEQIRRSRRLQALPVILLTALENDAHRARGLQVGANAYLFKSVAASATLLQTIAQLL